MKKFFIVLGIILVALFMGFMLRHLLWWTVKVTATKVYTKLSKIDKDFEKKLKALGSVDADFTVKGEDKD